MRNVFCKVLGILLVLTLMAIQPAHAKLVLKIDDPSTSGTDLVIEDGGPLDFADEIQGYVEYCIGSGINLTCINAASKPREGTADLPVLWIIIDFLSWNGDLNISASETGFSNGPTAGQAKFFGTALGVDSVKIDMWTDPDNQSFGKSDLVYTHTDSGGNVIREQAVESGPVGSMTLQISLNSDGGEMNVGLQAQLALQQSNGAATVPNVVGMQEADAKTEIVDAGFSVGQTTTQASSQPVGEVLSQSPAGGASASPGTQVNLVVSAGDSPAEVLDPVGLAGLWYDPAFDGSGFNVLVFPDGWLVYYYGWRSNGERLWLLSETGTFPIVYGQSVTLDMFLGQSGTFQDPSPDLQPWGQMIIIFDSCGTGRAQMNGNDGSITLNLVKLVGIGVLDCG